MIARLFSTRRPFPRARIAFSCGSTRDTLSGIRLTPLHNTNGGKTLARVLFISTQVESHTNFTLCSVGTRRTRIPGKQRIANVYTFAALNTIGTWRFPIANVSFPASAIRKTSIAFCIACPYVLANESIKLLSRKSIFISKRACYASKAVRHTTSPTISRSFTFGFVLLARYFSNLSATIRKQRDRRSRGYAAPHHRGSIRTTSAAFFDY